MPRASGLQTQNMEFCKCDNTFRMVEKDILLMIRIQKNHEDIYYRNFKVMQCDFLPVLGMRLGHSMTFFELGRNEDLASN